MSLLGNTSSSAPLNLNQGSGHLAGVSGNPTASLKTGTLTGPGASEETAPVTEYDALLEPCQDDYYAEKTKKDAEMMHLLGKVFVGAVVVIIIGMVFDKLGGAELFARLWQKL
jgi:hypothetical protein